MPNIDSTRDARDDLRTRWIAAGEPTGGFRPRTRKAKDDESWTEMVCVDAHGQVIPGIKAVRFRPTVTGTTTVLAVGDSASMGATE